MDNFLQLENPAFCFRSHNNVGPNSAMSLISLFFCCLFFSPAPTKFIFCSFVYNHRTQCLSRWTKFAQCTRLRGNNQTYWPEWFFIWVAGVKWKCGSGKLSTSVPVRCSSNWHKMEFIVWEGKSKAKSFIKAFTKHFHMLLYNKVNLRTQMTQIKAKVSLFSIISFHGFGFFSLFFFLTRMTVVLRCSAAKTVCVFFCLSPGH